MEMGWAMRIALGLVPDRLWKWLWHALVYTGWRQFWRMVRWYACFGTFSIWVGCVLTLRFLRGERL